MTPARMAAVTSLKQGWIGQFIPSQTNSGRALTVTVRWLGGQEMSGNWTFGQLIGGLIQSHGLKSSHNVLSGTERVQDRGPIFLTDPV